MNFVSHGTQDMYPTFLKTYRGYSPQTASNIAMFYNVGAIVGGIVVGRLSDYLGRRRAMIAALLLAIAAVWPWAYGATTGTLLFGAFMLQFMVQGAWGVVPAHINELSPDSVRGFLPGFAYQCGVAVASSVNVIEDLLKDRVTYANAMALSALLAFGLAAIVVALGREKHAAPFGVTS